MKSAAQPKQRIPTITDKTLVAWVYLDNRTQRGGSVLTLDDQRSHFDGIVFGEISPGKWMAGSDGFRRTSQEQASFPEETAGPKVLVQVAVVYKGNEVTVYRNAEIYSHHTITQPQTFGEGSVVVFGLRHLEAGDRACFAGEIDEARIYDVALSEQQISSLQRQKVSSPLPLAWWTFEDGCVADRTGNFTDSLLIGNAHVIDHLLTLDGKESFMVAAPKGTLLAWFAQSRAERGGLLSASRQLRAKLLSDRLRPTYHFVAPEGFCMPFDPNGAIYWKGKYHLCYIFQDERGHCWGHASSADLVHWRFHPPALAPNPGDPDRGIFSGNAFINKKGEAVLLYHGVGVGNCIATSSEEELDNWTKLPSNPIVPSPREGDPGFGKYSSWDPHGWLEGDAYYAVFGGNPATLFKSKDMVKWKFLDRFLKHDMPDVEPDEDISCPDFFKLGNKHVLVCISHKRGCRYYTGRFEKERFLPESHHRMNWPGGTCFAPESLVDDKGRRIMWAWVLDQCGQNRINEYGWSGTMTLPRVLSLGEDGTLRFEPADELRTLRRNHRQIGGRTVPANSESVVKEARGDCLELAVSLEPREARECGLKVRRSPDGKEQTAIVHDRVKKCLRIELSHSTLDPEVVYRTFNMPPGGENPPVTAQEAPFELKPRETLRLRIFLDRSILEVFANGRQCVTQRIYPTRDDSVGVSLFGRGGSFYVKNLEAWDMVPANQW